MRTLKNTILIIFSFISFISCDNEESLGESNLDQTTPKLTDLDKWIRDEYIYTFNIEVLYRWRESAVDMNRYLYPPKIENIQPALKAIKKVWIDSYNEAANNELVRRIAPRQVLFVGGKNLNPSGTRTLGSAEGGKRITFYETDLVNLKEKPSLLLFLGTMQHEYCHILNQTLPFDEQKYQKITPANYTAQWFNESLNVANELGYITQYSRASVIEDFAEMVRIMLSKTRQQYESRLKLIERRIVNKDVAKAIENIAPGTTPAQKKAIIAAVKVIATEKAKKSTALIRAKENLVVEYYKSNLNIDFYELQAIVARNVDEIIEDNNSI